MYIEITRVTIKGCNANLKNLLLIKWHERSAKLSKKKNHLKNYEIKN